MEASSIRMLRIREVMLITGLARSTVWLCVKRGTLPTPVKIGIKSVAWSSLEIDQVVKARLAGFSEEAIKDLVKRLEGERGEFLQMAFV